MVTGSCGSWRVRIMRLRCEIDPGNLLARANLAEMEFRQKQVRSRSCRFCGAGVGPANPRPSPATKCFSCDLFAAHDEAARLELQAFNASGEETPPIILATSPGTSSITIRTRRAAFSPRPRTSTSRARWSFYAASLLQLGYLPLPEVR